MRRLKSRTEDKGRKGIMIKLKASDIVLQHRDWVTEKYLRVALDPEVPGDVRYSNIKLMAAKRRFWNGVYARLLAKGK